MHEKLRKARMALILNEPFFATLAMRFQYKETTEFPKTAIDGVTFFYNPEFVESQSIKRLKTVIAHNIMHVANRHHLRRGARDAAKWDEACDVVVNSQLTNSGFELSDDDAFDPEYNGASVERLYQEGENAEDEGGSGCGEQPGEAGGGQQGNPEGEQPSDDGGPGQVLPFPNPAEAEEENRKLSEEVATAMRQAEKAGKLPNDLRRQMEEAMSVMDWRDMLREFISRSHITRYQWNRPSRRSIAIGDGAVFLPARESSAVGHVVVAIDTSRSIDQQALNQFGAELNAMLDDHTVAKMTVICCDAKVQSVTELNAGDEVEFDIKGGGRTRFSPAIDAARDVEPDVMLYFTDLYCRDYGDEPPFPILWLDFAPKADGKPNHQPPFGDVVPIR